MKTLTTRTHILSGSSLTEPDYSAVQKQIGDLPQEEEFMISGLSPILITRLTSFPKKMVEFFTSFALVKPEISVKWKKLFLFLIKKINYACKGKQLILKNPELNQPAGYITGANII